MYKSIAAIMFGASLLLGGGDASYGTTGGGTTGGGDTVAQGEPDPIFTVSHKESLKIDDVRILLRYSLITQEWLCKTMGLFEAYKDNPEPGIMLKELIIEQHIKCVEGDE